MARREPIEEKEQRKKENNDHRQREELLFQIIDEFCPRPKAEPKVGRPVTYHLPSQSWLGSG